MAGKRILNKVLECTIHSRESALIKLAKLQRDHPNAVFKIEGNKSPYEIYQIWYQR